MTRWTEDARVRYSWPRTTNYIYYIALAITLVVIWLGDLSNLTTYLGLLSAGVAIALSAPITNVAGWVFIFWRHPFEIGDCIQMGEHAGDVIYAHSISPCWKKAIRWMPTTIPIVYTDVKESGVLLTIRYLCKPHERRKTSKVIWEQILETFEGHEDIDLAYPTIHDNQS